MTEQRRRLRCFGCSSAIELPYQSLEEKPTAVWPITIVCRNCFRQASYGLGDIRFEEVQTPPQKVQADVLWQVSFQCAHQNCSARKREVYLSCEYFLMDEAPKFVLNATEPIRCDEGHILRHLNMDAVQQVRKI